MFNKSKQQTPERKGTPPTHVAYHVREYNDDAGQSKGFWTRIGSVRMHQDGEGCNVKVDNFPLNGKIVIRPLKEKQDDA